MEKQTRFEYNLKIIDKLKELIIKYPDLRFGQILVNCDIIRYEKEVLCDGQRENLLTVDPFNEESEITWNRMYNNKFAFKERFN